MENPRLNLDTHLVVKLIAGELTREELALLDGQTCGISAIVIWELRALHRRGRIRFDVEGEREAAFLADLTIWPVTAEICHLTQRLDFQSDPADELIAATSLAHGVPLLTRDDKILASKVVPLA
jgi:PIN domain nuclease of toxin-antitoxin system